MYCIGFYVIVLLANLIDNHSVLLAAYRTATLRHDETNQAMLLNLLLRNYLHYNLYDQADKLVSKTTFPPTASNNQTARYMYYLGMRCCELTPSAVLFIITVVIISVMSL